MGVLMIGFVGVVRWYRERKRLVTPKERLEKHLKAIDSSPLNQREKAAVMSRAFREYLKRKAFGDFPTKTLREGKELMCAHPTLTQQQKGWILLVLEGVEQVKYACQELDPDTWREMKEAIHHFVSSVEVE